ncbi:MAG: MarC family transcriptional regulator [Gammaproteobacteria bacterium]|nr:MAG: MarC family transcriptional regulator [Gammaproteobacteria bacterium]
MLNDFLANLLIFFLLINPIGLVPVFLSLTHGTPLAYKQKMAIKGPLIAWFILVVFGYLGEPILSGLGISLDAFRVGGGLLLGVTGFRMVLEQRQKSQKEKARELNPHDLEDISVFPIASLFIAGPGAITAMMINMSKNTGHISAQLIILAAITSIIVIVMASFILSSKISKYLPEEITSVISRVLGMLLLALSMQLIFDGIKSAFGLVS